MSGGGGSSTNEHPHPQQDACAMPDAQVTRSAHRPPHERADASYADTGGRLPAHATRETPYASRLTSASCAIDGRFDASAFQQLYIETAPRTPPPFAISHQRESDDAGADAVDVFEQEAIARAHVIDHFAAL